MLKLIKKGLGRDCSFLSFSKEKIFNHDTNKWTTYDCFRAVMGKDKVVIPIEKGISQLDNDDYGQLYTILKDKQYLKDGQRS